MIRPFTCVCMLLAGGSGLYLYQSKHKAQMLDREIGRVLKQTDATREQIGRLRAEWAVLNEPDRLAELSRQHLGLRQLSPTQFVAVAELGARLPPPLPPGSVLATAEDPTPPPAAPAPVVPVSPTPAPRIAAATPRAPAPAPPRAPEPVVAAVPPPAAPVQVAAVRPPPARPAPRVAHAQEQRDDAPHAPAAPVQVAAPRPMVPTAPVVSVSATPITLSPRQLMPATPLSIGDSVLRASALGGARAALPPPTPYGVR